MIKVGFLTPSLLRGGAEIWQWTLAKHLGRSCKPVGIVLTDPKSADPWLLDRVESVMPVLTPDHETTVRDCVAELADRSNVLISWGLPSLPALTAGLRLPVVDVSHSDGDWPAQREMVEQSARGAAFHVGVSDAACRAFPDDTPFAPVTIYNGVDLGTLQPERTRAEVRAEWGVPQGAKVAITVGRLEEVKQPWRLIEAVSHLSDKWHAVFVGGGSLELFLRSQAERIPGRVHFAGQRDDIADQLLAADVFVLPSRYEGFPLVLVEAWLMGLPTVTGDFGFAREINARYEGRILRRAQDDQQISDMIVASQHRDLQFSFKSALTDFTAVAFARRWERFLVKAVNQFWVG